MKQTIQYFYKPKTPVPATSVTGVVKDRDLSDARIKHLNSRDRTLLDEEWEKVQQEQPNVFSKPKGLGSLYDTSSFPTLYYATTDFKTYVATSRLADRGIDVSSSLEQTLRISSVGCAVTLIDGSVLVHKRPDTATHVAGKYDSGVAGLAHVRPDNTLDFVYALKSKFVRELTVDPSTLTDMQLLSVHSGSAPDFSGMVDFHVRLPLTFNEITQKANPAYLQDVFPVPIQELPDYLVRSFTANEIVADGCAVLLSSLPHDVFLETISRINAAGKRIFFGTLRDSIFFES